MFDESQRFRLQNKYTVNQCESMNQLLASKLLPPQNPGGPKTIK